MRLLLVISSLGSGGAERVLSLLASHWAAGSHEVHLVTTQDRGHPPHYRLDERIKLESVDPGTTGLTRQIKVVKALRTHILASRPDCIISFLNYTNILALAAARGLRVPVIVSERLDPRVIGIGPLWSLARRLTYRSAARLVSQTPTAARLYEPLAPGRTSVIPNPVLPVERGEDWPDRLRNARTVLSVGRLQYQKGHDLALEAFAGLGPEFSAWRLIVLGEGPLRGELEARRDRLGLQGRVAFPGTVADTLPFLHEAGLFLMASRSEGFPNALCEAMSAGLPCLATDCPSGPADIITHGVDGWLVPPGDSAGVRDALAHLMGSTEERLRLAMAAPAVARKFSQETVLQAWDQLLREVTNGSAPAAPGRTDPHES